jgi:hypothetical protein
VGCCGCNIDENWADISVNITEKVLLNRALVAMLQTLFFVSDILDKKARVFVNRKFLRCS